MGRDNYVFITVFEDRVSFNVTSQKNGCLTGADPVLDGETPEAVIARFVTKFAKLGYEIEIRDERTAKPMEDPRLANCVARFVTPDKYLEYVLCVWKRWNGLPVEWVVWTYNNQDKGFFDGHYFSELALAVECYESKVATSTSSARY